MPKRLGERLPSEIKPEEVETKISKTTEIESTPQKPVLPNIKDLDEILEESNQLATVASLSEGEIDEIIEKRQESLDKFHECELIREQRLRTIEQYNPLKNLTSSDYKQLVEEGMIDSEYAERLEKVDDVIAKLEALSYPTSETVEKLEELGKLRNSFRENLDSQIEQKRQEISQRQEEIKNKILEHYKESAEKFKKIIIEIEDNPRVIDRLRIIAKKMMKESEDKIEQERQKLLSEATRFIRSLSTRHANSFKRLSEITGDEDIESELLQALNEQGSKQQSTFDKVRSRIIKSIIEGEGEGQVKDAKELVPWTIYSTSIPYVEAMNTISYHDTIQALKAAADDGDERAKRLLEDRKQIVSENEIIRKLVGKKWITDKKTNEKHLGTFWAAFATRKENDSKGITEARRKERKEALAKAAEFKKAADEIIERGGFVVKVPVLKKIKGKLQVVGNKKGVIRLEQAKSKKGNGYWKVVEILGASNGLKVGAVSPLNMQSFPQWLQDSANQL